MGEGMRFEYCPSCGHDLDTGWECTRCERDWRPWAYPWWRRIIDKIKTPFQKKLRWCRCCGRQTSTHFSWQVCSYCKRGEPKPTW